MKDVAAAKMLNTVRHMRVMTENDFGTLHYRLFFEFHQPLCRPIAVLIAAMNAQDDHVHGSRRFPNEQGTICLYPWLRQNRATHV